MQLKAYQQRSLDTLAEYFRLVVEDERTPKTPGRVGAQTAFELLFSGRPYFHVPGLDGMPYICLRVPTGGGKTVMASHAVGIAARDFLHAERVVCLWLVPSNVIREQTLAALNDREHAYRQALDAAFGGNVVVMDLADALYVSHGTLSGATAVIISTLAALRVEEIDGRKVYESNGNLQPHFIGLDDALKRKLETEGDGRVIFSLANVLRLRRPVVIMDEAHNARTPLSFETLTRFNPSCVIEFTATPELNHNPAMSVYASNVLHHVSARELKEAEMIKLPIKLRTRPDWKIVLTDAIAKRKELEALAEANEKATGEYLRPIMLIQAQPQNKNKPTLTVDVAKQALMNDHQIPEEQIAIATGQTRELENVNLFERGPIRFIITVQALKEGWDCSFAYVLCSLAEQHSARSVEQILGRILRMPRARKKSNPDLNVAYAFAVSSSFVTTANSLKDGLIENGFENIEAKSFIVADLVQQQTFEDFPMFGTTAETVSETPDLASLEPELRERITFDESTKELTVTGILGEAEQAALEKCFPSNADRPALERLRIRSQGRKAARDVDPERPLLRVPALSIRLNGQLELFDESHFLLAPWDLAKCDATLTEMELPSSWSGSQLGEIDVTQAGKVELTHYVNDLHEQMSLLTGESGWEVVTLVRWLDRNIRHPDIPQVQSSLFIHRLISELIERRGVTVEQLARIKFHLRAVIENKINGHRDAHHNRAYQAFLFGDEAPALEVNPSISFTFDEDRYTPSRYYEGSYKFKRHYFPYIGEMKAKGEEHDCAVFIDQLDEVRYWIRNIPRRTTSFSLPTSKGRFYPDFIVLLRDGRILVVEYKGGYLVGAPDAKEKKAVGDLWAAKSGGRCLFVMPTNRGWQAIIAAIR